MNDRQLLEAAARAAGIELCWFEVQAGDPDCAPGWYCTNVTEGGIWSPLTDDGDALRLAVKLRLAVDCMNDGNVFVGYGRCLEGRLQRAHEVSEFSGAECDTRRAIVRAAAAMAGGQ